MFPAGNLLALCGLDPICSGACRTPDALERHLVARLPRLKRRTSVPTIAGIVTSLRGSPLPRFAVSFQMCVADPRNDSPFNLPFLPQVPAGWDYAVQRTGSSMKPFPLHPHPAFLPPSLPAFSSSLSPSLSPFPAPHLPHSLILGLGIVAAAAAGGWAQWRKVKMEEAGNRSQLRGLIQAKHNSHA